MPFFPWLNRREKRLKEKIQTVLKQCPDLDVSYYIEYKFKGGNKGQTYVFAPSDAQAKTKAERMAQSCGGELLLVRKSSEMFYNKKTKKLEPR